MERPEPFIVTDSHGLLTVEPGMKKRLDESQDQLVVVAVVGAYRTGKSFLLNRLMNKQDGFPLGATVQSKTKGIWSWISRHPRSPERLLLLLDTEGLDDPEKADGDVAETAGASDNAENAEGDVAETAETAATDISPSV